MALYRTIPIYFLYRHADSIDIIAVQQVTMRVNLLELLLQLKCNIHCLT